MYAETTAQNIANRFRAENPDALNVRVEKRKNGQYRAVYDHLISKGKKSQNREFLVDRSLIASWNVNISPESWDLIYSLMSREQADIVRAEVEPKLPKGWFFKKKDFFGGMLYVTKEGKKTMVTSHC